VTGIPGWAIAGTAALSLTVTLILMPVLRSTSVRWGLLDYPNPRSTHRAVTPRAGGLALIASAALCLALTRSVWAGSRGATALLAGAVIIGLVGALDDRVGLPPLPKFAFQLAAAVVCVGGTGGLARLPLPPPLDIALGPAGGFAAILWIVAVVNFYNFLDGIDGLAGLQGVITGVGVAVAAWDPLAGILGTAVAAGCAGFLFFNWHPARIFLGDVGSGFLGYTFATLPLLASSDSRVEAVLFVAMSLWLFLADATWTLGRRAARDARWHEAHREHLYQRLVILGSSQPIVAASVGAGSALMTALALMAWRSGPLRGAWWLVIVVGMVLLAAEMALVRRRGVGVRAG
jgi:Fuc2NAc and GlcNAc transferase